MPFMTAASGVVVAVSAKTLVLKRNKMLDISTDMIAFNYPP